MSLSFDNSRTSHAVSQLLLSSFLLLLTMAMAGNDDSEAMKTMAQNSFAFTRDLYKLLSQKEGNIFFSPLSVQVVLALAYSGAGGNTARQMQKALYLPEEKLLRDGFRGLMKSMHSTDSMILDVANKIFSEKTFSMEEQFSGVAKTTFLSEAEEMNFKGDPEGSTKIINRWVEDQTHKKILNLIPEGLITGLTRLVLVNAIYFKGKWKQQFDPAMTNPQAFYTSKQNSKEVEMMHTKKKFGYTELDELNCKVLVMPYKGDQISMMILLPNEIDGLSKLEDQMDRINLANIMSEVSKVEVEVSLPRFKLETSIDLNEILKQLGMTDMFDEKAADFSGISKEEGLYVSNVLQKAFIEVNEEGSEAAAATGMVLTFMCASPPPEVFNADHPFLFSLVNVDSGLVLFQGRIVNI